MSEKKKKKPGKGKKLFKRILKAITKPGKHEKPSGKAGDEHKGKVSHPREHKKK